MPILIIFLFIFAIGNFAKQQLNILIMEIKVYRNFKDCQNNKHVFCAKIECPDLFYFDFAVKLFKSIFPECVVLVMAV